MSARALLCCSDQPQLLLQALPACLRRPGSCCDLPRSRILLAFFAFWKRALANRFLLGYCLLRDAIVCSDGLTTPGRNANDGDKLFSCCFNLRFERLRGIPGLRSAPCHAEGVRPACVNKQTPHGREMHASEIINMQRRTRAALSDGLACSAANPSTAG